MVWKIGVLEHHENGMNAQEWEKIENFLWDWHKLLL
jgi:hypothetical protein